MNLFKKSINWRVVAFTSTYLSVNTAQYFEFNIIETTILVNAVNWIAYIMFERNYR